MATTDKTPIVLVHGLWMTPKSWDTWAEYYRAKGHEVITLAWPGIGTRTPADLRRDPSAFEGIGITDIVDALEAEIRKLPVKPIIMGHSFGGLFTQMLADRGLGVAYVGVEPGQPAGISTLPFSTVRTAFPILRNPFRKNKASQISKAHFHFTFGNDLSRAESDAEYELNAIPSFNRVFFEGVAGALNEKGGASHVEYGRPERAPLLVLAGEIDHVVPPAIAKAIVKKYQQGAAKTGSSAVVEYQEFAGRTHRIVSQKGWEEVADYALDWAVTHAAK
jgi:pimeloyl-ACP methyl ester carboxylesterase